MQKLYLRWGIRLDLVKYKRPFSTNEFYTQNSVTKLTSKKWYRKSIKCIDNFYPRPHWDTHFMYCQSSLIEFITNNSLNVVNLFQPDTQKMYENFYFRQSRVSFIPRPTKIIEKVLFWAVNKEYDNFRNTKYDFYLIKWLQYFFSLFGFFNIYVNGEFCWWKKPNSIYFRVWSFCITSRFKMHQMNKELR